MQQGGDWRITGEDRAKHDAQFNQLKPVNGFITGDAARGFFLQSGLPQQVLGHIWTLSDMNADGKLDKLEFSIAMYLIKKKLTGTELPRTLPPSLKQAPAPVMGSFGPQAMGMAGGFGAMSGMQMGIQGGMGMSAGGFNTMTSRTGSVAGFGSAPGPQSPMARTSSMQASPERNRSSSVGGDWGVPQSTKLKYTQVFNTTDRTRSGFLTGAQARTLLLQSGLAQVHLAQIWGLADVDNDGRLTCEEFCLAMHLVDIVKSGKPLPQTLPPDLVPPSFRRGRSSSLSGGVPPTPAPAPAMPTPGMMANIGGGGFGGGGFGGRVPPGGSPALGSTPPNMAGPLGGGLMSGGAMPVAQGTPGGGLGALAGFGSPLMPTMVKQQSVDEGQENTEEERKFTPVSFEDKKRQNFERGQMELERRRAALREIQEKEKERQRELEQQEQERKERIRMEQERRKQLEFERQQQKQREVEAEREAQRRKLEEQREAARRELERQRQLELERQKRQELEAKRIKSQEEVCHLKATKKMLACEIETLEDKKNELNKKLSETDGFLKEHKTTIILMGQNRDARVAEIDQLHKKIQELRQFKQQRAQQKEELQEQAKKLNINPQVADTYGAVMTSYSNKKKTLEKMREALSEVEKKMAAKLEDTDNSNSRLAEMKATLAREQNEVDHLQKQYQVKMAEYSDTKKTMEDNKRNLQNQQNEKIKLGALKKKREEEEKQKKFEAIRLAQQQADRKKEDKKRKEEEMKKEEEKSKKKDPFASFGSSDNDSFASAFGNNTTSTMPADANDPFAAFTVGGSVQSSKPSSETKDPFAAFGDFGSSTFDFGQPFKAQSTSSSISSPASASTTSATTLATNSFASSPQPWTTTPATSTSTIAATPQPFAVTSASTSGAQASPLTVQPAAVSSSLETKTPAQDESSAGKNDSPSGTPTLLPTDLKSVLSQYRALYQFDAEGPDELSIKPGDIILVGKGVVGEPGWLGGELNGKTGWFPENYAEKIESPPSTPHKPEQKTQPAAKDSIDSLSWAAFGSNKKTEEVKKEATATASTSSPTLTQPQIQPKPEPEPKPHPQPQPRTSIGASVSASSTLVPSPVTVTPQEPVRAAPPAPTKSSKSPAPESTGQSKMSVSALAAAFTAAAEASTVPQISGPKPLTEPETQQPQKASEPQGSMSTDRRGSDLTEAQGSKATEAQGSEVTGVEEQIYDVVQDKPKPAEQLVTGGAGKDGFSPFTKVVSHSSSTPSPTPSQGSKTAGEGKVKAIYDWDAKKDNHLSFKAGEMITVIEKQDMWWMGEIEGRQGWFPKAHVQFLEDTSINKGAQSNQSEAFALYENTPKVQPDQQFALYANTPRVAKQASPTAQQQQQQQSPQPQQRQPKPAPQPVATTEATLSQQQKETSLPLQSGSGDSSKEVCTALYTYSSDEPGDLTFEAGTVITVTQKDAEWWTGRIGDREGIFPSNYVQVSTSGTTPAVSASSGGQVGQALGASLVVPADVAAKSGSLSRKPEIAKVIAPYEATGAEQLSLTAGQLIMVRKKNPSGWWEGELQARGKKRQIGWFPANYVKLMDSGSLGRQVSGTSDAPKSPNKLPPPSQANQRLTPGIDIVCQVITLYPYAKQNEDELSFQKGMVINVMSRDDPDWWRGELNGSTGVFPSNYVQELGESKSEMSTD